MTFDPLKLNTGLMDNEDVTITDAIFRTDPEFRDGQVLFGDFTLRTEDGDETNQWFACGNGWETTDDGATAVREDGREINFNNRCKIGEFFNGLVKVMGEDAKADKAIRERVTQFPLGPRDTGFWKGLKLHVDSQERKGDGAEISDYNVLVITGFNGIEGSAGAAPAGATKKAAKKASGATRKAAAAPPAEEAAEDVLAKVRAQLDEIADASEDHDAFMEAAFANVPEASSDETVKAAVSDGGEGSIWADAVARYAAANPS